LTLLAGLYQVVKSHDYKKFLISRPVVALGADVGYLPGDLQEKLFHWMQPIYDNLEFIFNKIHHEKLDEENAKERRHKKRHHKEESVSSEVERLQQKGYLSLEAITYMRGRSIPYQFVFIDETQNLTPHEIKTIITRVGEGTKIIIAGDPYQIDSPYLDFTSNGLTVSSEKFKGQSIFGTVFLETSERSEVAKIAAEIL
jgi:PhoH-like ATPase